MNTEEAQQPTGIQDMMAEVEALQSTSEPTLKATITERLLTIANNIGDSRYSRDTARLAINRIDELETFDIKTERIASDAREAALVARIDELEADFKDAAEVYQISITRIAELEAEVATLTERCEEYDKVLEKCAELNGWGASTHALTERQRLQEQTDESG
jgi:predicted nucleic acid-binding protein